MVLTSREGQGPKSDYPSASPVSSSRSGVASGRALAARCSGLRPSSSTIASASFSGSSCSSSRTALTMQCSPSATSNSRVRPPSRAADNAQRSRGPMRISLAWSVHQHQLLHRWRGEARDDRAVALGCCRCW